MHSGVNPDNRAYQRFVALASEHFEVSQWMGAEDEQPFMLSMIDLESGDCFTVSLVDSIEDTDPHVLAVFDPQCQMTSYVPFDGATAAARHAPRVAADGDDVAVTTPLRLHRPDVIALSAGMWIDVPPQIAAAADAALVSALAAIVVLLDRQRHRLCAVGPFATDAAAADWPLPPMSTRR